MPRIDAIKFLSRSDKYYVGGGNRLVFAPPFPLFLERPGFWDAAHYYNYELQPLFTWTLLDDNGREIPLEFNARRWTPACLTQQFTGRLGRLALIAEEEKALLPNDVALCRVRLLKWRGRRTRVHFIAWTTQEHCPSLGRSSTLNVERHGDAISFVRSLKLPNAPDLSIGLAMNLSTRLRSFCIQLSEGSQVRPDWLLSPLSERFHSGKFPNTTHLSGVDSEGLVTIALHTTIDLRSGEEHPVTIGLGAAPNPEEARANVKGSLRAANPVDISRRSWKEFFAGVPSFSCSDEFLTRYYWYRWYGLHLNTIDAKEGNYSSPFICEGIGYFRAPISYSAVCHILESRWRHSPELARGILVTFLENQRADGRFRGYIDPHHYREEMFYHANWGDALLALERIHPSREFLREAYEGLVNYVRYFDRERDEEISGLYDIDNHYETGQEYTRRYLAVNPDADKNNWGEVFRLKGVDVTVYIYQLKRALAMVAGKLGETTDAELWELEATKTRSAILEKMWDPDDSMFYDVDPATGVRTRVKAAVCFYPFLTDIVAPEHVESLWKHLLNPREFWSAYPVPTSSLDDPMFSPDAEWKGKRMNCPWNGRVWPMTNSHIAEALARTAQRFGDARLRRAAAGFVHRFVAMMFFEGDPARPNSFEHYNPLTGSPSIYRSIDDYQHSWVNDLILKYVCGIQVEDSGFTVDPLPFGLQYAVADDLSIQGARVKVELRRRKVTVWRNGRKAATTTIGKPIHIDLM
jgi:hypothetical protein